MSNSDNTYAFDLGRKTGSIECLLSPDNKRLLISFEVDPTGFTKTGVNGLIDALKKVRDKMAR